MILVHPERAEHESCQNAEDAIRLYRDDPHDLGEPVPEEKVVPQAITVTVAA